MTRARSGDGTAPNGRGAAAQNVRAQRGNGQPSVDDGGNEIAEQRRRGPATTSEVPRAVRCRARGNALQRAPMGIARRGATCVRAGVGCASRAHRNALPHPVPGEENGRRPHRCLQSGKLISRRP
ncbi:MAG: hypothetical protein U1F10_09730 [Burkholderiales bacterium]